MIISISQDRTIGEVQGDFSAAYPFLKLDFYRLQKLNEGMAVRKKLDGSLSLKSAGIRREGWLDVSGNMTVREIEKAFFEEFGLVAQVSRKSGMMWLETTHTDSWTLFKQNEYGREISLTVR